MPTLDLPVSPGYRALVEATGVVDLTGRTQLELCGDDAASFLHNFCTASIRNLQPGSGAEAFILNAKGHVLGHVFAFRGPSSAILDTVPGQTERLSQHLERYIIRENVEVRDRTDEWGVLLVAGPSSAALLESLALDVPRQRLAHGQSTLAGRTVYVRDVDLAGVDTWELVCQREDREALLGALVNAGAIAADLGDFEAARIEAGMPLFGRDITEENLPQEVNRDAQAISFTKGCYLGQETVARIDALGHVNRLLVGVRLQTTAPLEPASELFAADDDQSGGGSRPKPLGVVTSSTYSPRLQGALALAYVRRGHTKPGTVLESPAGRAEVIGLPL
jgi:folate-binding protein YgfZ